MFNQAETQELVSKWNAMLPKYLSAVSQLKDKLIEVERIRTQLTLIRDELKSRNVEIDEVPSNK